MCDCIFAFLITVYPEDCHTFLPAWLWGILLVYTTSKNKPKFRRGGVAV
jgi:hypothetical protein